MKPRMNFYEHAGHGMKALFSLNGYLAKSPVEKSLRELVSFRVSQLNGCAYCLDMHSKDLRAGGESEQRLHMLPAWREAPLYSARERAALAWAEAVTKLDVPDEVYEQAMAEFSETELADLTLSIIGINSFTRINIAFRTPAGDYQPGQHAALVN